MDEGAVARPGRSVRVAAFLAGTTVALVALAGCGTGPVALDAPDLDGATARTCDALVEALPETVADQPAREVSPADVPGAAWGDPPIELVCGVPRPEGFDRVSTCTTVNDVDWFVPEEQLDRRGDLTMTVVNREVYVEVRLPEEHWPPATTLADLADAVRESVPATGACS